MTHWSNISLVFVISMTILLFAHAHNGPQDFTDAHQCVRKALGLNPLCWDEEVAKVAQAYAEVRVDCALKHSLNPKYGENIAYGPELNASYAVQLWVDERPEYDVKENKCINMCGHYTQVVWRNTERVGCGRAKCTNHANPDYYFIVCNYDPPGNYIGQRPY